MKQYWNIPFHEFNQWTSPPELYFRSINGLDLSCNLSALILNQDNKISFLVGHSVRRRSELFFYDCHQNGFWYECLASSSLFYDIGCNVMLDADFLIWKQFGISSSANYRIYNGSITSISLNASIFYQFSWGKVSDE